MKLIEDLGMVYATTNSKVKKLYGIYECPNCLKHIRTCTHNVNDGISTQCKSCATKAHKTTHGDRAKRVRLYSIWTDMKNRCYNKNNQAFKNYGDKGVTVCDEWKNDYLSFKEWSLDNGYKNTLEIDKDILCHKLDIFPKIYSPKTCLWVTKSENSIDANKRRAKCQKI